MSTDWLQILAAAIAGCGFGLIFRIHYKHFVWIFIGAGLSWFTYLFIQKNMDSRVLSMLIASIAVTVFSEIVARIRHVPASVIYIPSIIPLIPGSNLYYVMRGFISGDTELCSKFGELLLKDTFGIVMGSVIVFTVVAAINAGQKHSSPDETE